MTTARLLSTCAHNPNIMSNKRQVSNFFNSRENRSQAILRSIPYFWNPVQLLGILQTDCVAQPSFWCEHWHGIWWCFGPFCLFRPWNGYRIYCTITFDIGILICFLSNTDQCLACAIGSTPKQFDSTVTTLLLF